MVKYVKASDDIKYRSIYPNGLTDEEISWLQSYGHDKELNKILSKYRTTGDIEIDEINLSNKAQSYFYDTVGIYNDNIACICNNWAYDSARKLH